MLFFVLKSLLGIARQWSLEKSASLILKLLSRVRILIYLELWLFPFGLKFSPVDVSPLWPFSKNSQPSTGGFELGSASKQPNILLKSDFKVRTSEFQAYHRNHTIEKNSSYKCLNNAFTVPYSCASVRFSVSWNKSTFGGSFCE